MVGERRHCDDHDDFHETLTRVATNTEWLIKAMKTGLAVIGGIVTLVIIPTAIWLISLDKRVSFLEAQQTKVSATKQETIRR